MRYLNWQKIYERLKFEQMQDQLRSFTIPVPVEVKVHTVPHSKAPVNAKVGPGGLKCGGAFM